MFNKKNRLDNRMKVICNGIDPDLSKQTTSLSRKELRFGEDVEWLGRLDAAGIDCPVLDRVLARKRIHRGNTTHQTGAMTTATGPFSASASRLRGT